MKHVIGFVSIDEVKIIAADQLGQAADEKLAAAGESIDAPAV